MERTEVEKFDSESSESIDWEKNNRKRNQVLGNSMYHKNKSGVSEKNEAVSLHARKAICKGENA